MRRRGRMACERSRVAQVDQPYNQVQFVVKANSGVVSATNPESHQRTGAPAQIFLRQRVIWAFRKAGVIYPFHARIVAQEFRDALGIFHVSIDAQRYRFDSLQQQESAQRREHRPERSLAYAAATRYIRRAPKMLGVNQAV